MHYNTGFFSRYGLDRKLEAQVLTCPYHSIFYKLDIELCDLGLQSGAQDMPAFESMTLEALELWALKKALQRCPDVSKAAEALGLSRGALYRRLEKFGLSG